MDSFTPAVSYSPNKYCKVTVKCQEINQVYENVDYDLDAKQAGQNVDVAIKKGKRKKKQERLATAKPMPGMSFEDEEDGEDDDDL